jgi:hypothetical protein
MKPDKVKILKKGYTNEILPFPQELEFHNKLHTELPMPKQIPNYETPEQMHWQTYRKQGMLRLDSQLGNFVENETHEPESRHIQRIYQTV